MNTRILPLARLLLGASFALGILCDAAQAADAIRTAAAMALMVRRSDSAEDRRAILSSGFDAMRDAPAPVPGRNRARSRHVWFVDVKEGAAPVPPTPAAELPAPQVQERVGLAFAVVLAPWKTLLDSAWGGAWSGLTEMQNWSSS